MIKIDKIDDGLPISVIVPLSEKREKFFYEYVYPLIEINNPNEIIINKYNGLAPKKRNMGFDKSTQPYVFFCDDDILLPNEYLLKLYNALTKAINVGYVYTGYNGIVLHPETHPMKGNFEIKSNDFNANLLKKTNYISTMSLIKREVFPRFDENLKRFQDWDIYLTMLSNGIVGKFVKDLRFMAYYIDSGITTNNNDIYDAYRIIKHKHNL